MTGCTIGFSPFFFLSVAFSLSLPLPLPLLPPMLLLSVAPGVHVAAASAPESERPLEAHKRGRSVRDGAEPPAGHAGRRRAPYTATAGKQLGGVGGKGHANRAARFSGLDNCVLPSVYRLCVCWHGFAAATKKQTETNPRVVQFLFTGNQVNSSVQKSVL